MVKVAFIVAVAAQLVLGLWRARLIGSSIAPALALAALIATAGVIGRWPAMARFGALLATTAGVLSAISACNAPLIGNVARISVPLFAFSIALILYLPKHRLAAALFLIAVAVLEYDLTRDALWESDRTREAFQSVRAQEKSWITKSSVT